MEKFQCANASTSTRKAEMMFEGVVNFEIWFPRFSEGVLRTLGISKLGNLASLPETAQFQNFTILREAKENFKIICSPTQAR